MVAERTDDQLIDLFAEYMIECDRLRNQVVDLYIDYRKWEYVKDWGEDPDTFVMVPGDEEFNEILETKDISYLMQLRDYLQNSIDDYMMDKLAENLTEVTVF